MADETRSERRQARYKYLRSLGFDSAQARRLRDRSGRNIEREVKQERRRISRKKRTNRSKPEQERLDAITLSSTETLLETRQRRFMSRGDRYSNFSVWSSRSSQFPPWALTRIHEYNRARRLPRDDAFGYRRFYYWYVERIADFENEIFADRGDSGIRNLRGVPLSARTSARRIA